jgi:hypothetical protein
MQRIRFRLVTFAIASLTMVSGTAALILQPSAQTIGSGYSSTAVELAMRR